MTSVSEFIAAHRGEKGTNTRLDRLKLMNAEPLALFLKFASYGTVQILHYLYGKITF